MEKRKIPKKANQESKLVQSWGNCAHRLRMGINIIVRSSQNNCTFLVINLEDFPSIFYSGV